MNNSIVKNGFFENVNEIRNIALNYEYTKSNENTGWKGYRAELQDIKIKNSILSELIKIDPIFNSIEFDLYFHYSLDETKNELNDFWRQRFHRDGYEWAGVIYLTPNPPTESGTIIFDDNNKNPITIENVYNRLILYKGNILHGVEDTFGKDIYDGRMTLTIFGKKKDKKNKTIL